jgi:hypothetical protein
LDIAVPKSRDGELTVAPRLTGGDQSEKFCVLARVARGGSAAMHDNAMAMRTNVVAIFMSASFHR